MKVLYKNKVGKAVSLRPCDPSCSDCIFCPDSRDIKHVVTKELCQSV